MINIETETQDEDGSEEGGTVGGIAGTGDEWIEVPDLFVQVKSKGKEKLNAELAATALAMTRIDLRRQGHNVKALTKQQSLLEDELGDLANIGQNAGNLMQQGSGFDAHPELTDMGGINNIVLPNSEKQSRSMALDAHNKLRLRQVARLRQQNKYKFTPSSPRQRIQPRFSAKPLPKPKP